MGHRVCKYKRRIRRGMDGESAMVGIVTRAWIGGFVLTLALSGTAFSDGLERSAFPLDFDLAYEPAPDYPSRSYLDDLVPATRMQDKRRIKIRYDHPIRMGQTKMVLRFRASPKPRKIVRFEVKF